jgi:hypothetical protein
MASKGLAIYYYGDFDLNHGLTNITLDGEQVSINTYGPWQRQVLLFQRTGLQDTNHTMVITHAEPTDADLNTSVDRLMSVTKL